jgi:NAD(P)-dependent dehydrogenase (short-subunit alcohol dehydrogenase family)
MDDLHGVRALITGGTSGLGRTMAAALVASGARVAITGRSEGRVAAAARELGSGTIGIAMDSRNERSVDDGTAAAWDALDGIGLLVNNAGIGMRTVNPDFMTRPQGFWEVSPDGFRDVVDTNLTGYFLVARSVVPRMLDTGAGRVVTISMNHGTMNRRGFVPYGPSRAGAEALARIMAADLADTPVRANILLPGGATDTGMLAGTARPDGLPVLPADVVREPIRWLASDEAADVHDERIVATEFADWLSARRS